MWSSHTLEATPSLRRIGLLQHALPASFRAVIDGWRTDAGFRTWFNALLAESAFAAFRWETPSVTELSVDQPFQFVLLDAPSLARAPESEVFAEHFRRSADGQVATFHNLGRDAMLVVPLPNAAPSAYGHLADFVRHAPEPQRDTLWQAVGDALAQRLGPKPVWLSTAGAGVAWLHVRLDGRPKYYGYPPFTGAIAPRLRAIAGKLDQLIREGRRPSGWEAHQMRLAPAVSEAELVSFEHLHGVQLPADYRAFLQQVSGGGLGPALGLIPLGKYPREWHSESLKDSLRDPFPYTEEYAPQPDQVESDPSRHTVGTLVVCHEGCGYLQRLVVSGPARGQVWIDGTCSDYGLRPIAGSFLDWYESWLDHALLGGNGLV